MNKYGKRIREAKKSYDIDKIFVLDEAIDLLKAFPPTRFDESIDLSFNFNVDSRKADQIVRISLVLPHGSGKTKRVLAFVQPDQIQDAKDAGADYIGDDELIQKIKKGWFDFEAVVAVPSLMKKIASLGRFLGSRGLMPSPKSGTVTQDVVSIISEIKKGRLDARVDKNNDMRLSIGKLSFDKNQIKENIEAVFENILKAKPTSVKGQYIRQISISSTMGPGVKVVCPT